MILREDTKFSCVECIRGHRSSLCKHHERPLIQVRAKGRPNIQNNPNYRIAIFAKKFDPIDNGIKIIQSSIEYIIDFKTGEIIGPYTEISQIQRNPQIEINDKSFINTPLCCSNGFKSKTSCGCKHTNPTSKILKKYLKKNKNQLQFINNNNEAKRESLRDEINRSLRKKGSFKEVCNCDDSCECETCIIHNGEANGFDLGKELDYAIRDIFDPPIVGADGTANDAATGVSSADTGTGTATSTGSGTDTTAAATTTTTTSGNLGLDDILHMLFPIQDKLSNEIPAASPTPDDCTCPESECKCTNCETHGIINGIKLDDLFGNIDYRLLSM